MSDSNLPLDNNAIPFATFADLAVEAGLWLVLESIDAIANKTDFDPDPEKCFRVLGRLPAIRQLRELTEDQRHDMFVEGFRRVSNCAQDAFELLLANQKELLWEALRKRWNVVDNEVPFG
ncbi:MAG: hypothetical protein BGP05_03935 [Rhizobiales bacterium 62-47]|nr:hypothetical protein [Hyphomicrobiales bacterium]OJY13062.1 MAG: hypothetical protein BGP05_03935 [Rhizobiales bacterium 62-47]